ncbi:hypothetical protein B0H16DRAFT_1716245 [Mycena metata]|uniref:Uncharacterized protein n=1 Tax=Mycena metata TaxID=1033252 RepID=A0AAD7NP19_9AGAR|nr:hypothetical protein B0H16DRAFT_1716245 [Mycena metata]
MEMVVVTDQGASLTTLSSLTLSPSYGCSPAVWLAYDCDLLPTFRQLRTVTIGCDGPFLRPVHDFLAHLPALQNLTLSGEYRRCTDTSRSSPERRCPVPLAPFCGLESPHALFTHFPRLATLRLVISNAPLEDDPDMCDGVETVDAEVLVDLPDILATVLRAPTELAHAVIEWDLSCDVVGMLPALVDLRALVPQVRIVFEGGVRAEGMDESTDTNASESGSDESTEMEFGHIPGSLPSCSSQE